MLFLFVALPKRTSLVFIPLPTTPRLLNFYSFPKLCHLKKGGKKIYKFYYATKLNLKGSLIIRDNIMHDPCSYLGHCFLEFIQLINSLKFRSKFSFSEKSYLTYNHKCEFKPSLHWFSVNLIWEICKSHIAFKVLLLLRKAKRAKLSIRQQNSSATHFDVSSLTYFRKLYKRLLMANRFIMLSIKVVVNCSNGRIELSMSWQYNKQLQKIQGNKIKMKETGLREKISIYSEVSNSKILTNHLKIQGFFTIKNFKIS